MAYTDKLRVVYGDYTKADWNLSLKTDMSGCTVAQNLLFGER